ncbi:tellurium resistance protein TerW [Yersinia pseudotuberculosis]|uniref:Tellurium resistance protein TerW n=2 Tax=Yersinia pseudotuberculosis complex TaxID=1649845 RepID=A0A0T9JK43_YERPU|nr:MULTISPECIES: tellurium resistance protein TerW [Yersinia pseudotuberculosis complex]PSH22011.1 tellurium resistance protein TerW [Yersinia pseudotuberculosis]CNC84643.1 Uncharacterised protein [Yersinia pseudotuberculosis]CRG50767.1 Uncharacterised protein [Yersinia wautersii]SUP86502.1 Uncharacterised protein [Yersinia pseudotuberculosis]
MLLSTKQFRHYTLALLLASGKPVDADDIYNKLSCSGPTLTRALKELRETYNAEIRYSKSTHSYQLTEKGTLTPKVLRHIKDAIASHMIIKSHEELVASHVILDKEKKRSISLSLRMSVIRKIDRVVNQLEITRSEAVEILVNTYISELMLSVSKPPKGKKSV